MGKASIALPFTTRTMVIGSLALCGIPFLAGYYSKDLILEAAQYRISKTVRVFFAIIATLMTAAYSARIVFFLSSSKNSRNSIKPISEENYKMTKPLLRLLVGVFLAG
jgi:NADH:ubiquinone oxidoreductase subunit 5 (subunit L)/multisubunit Na+/H+ antiporter MnhA subunit